MLAPNPMTSFDEGGSIPEAEYTLEARLICSACREEISSLKVIRMLRTQVNFTSTLPRRGRAIACPQCSTILSAELGALS